MIFVTVGTHEQAFNRLLKKVNMLIEKGIIQEKVIMQTGFSDYKPKECTVYPFLSFEKMNKYINDARIVITHGGPASFLEVLQAGKTPIVVPRQEKYSEHINNHQVDFVKIVEKKMNNIIPVYNIDELDQVIVKYDELSRSMQGISNNNNKFNNKFEAIVDELFGNNHLI